MGLPLVAPVLPALALAGLPARALSGAFLTRVFKRDDGARAAWPLQFADIVARYTRSPHEP